RCAVEAGSHSRNRHGPTIRESAMTDAEITLEPEAVKAAVHAYGSLNGIGAFHPEKIERAIRAYRALSRSTLPREGQGEVGVRPLVWHGPDCDDEYWAKSIIGTFSIGGVRSDGT